MGIGVHTAPDHTVSLEPDLCHAQYVRCAYSRSCLGPRDSTLALTTAEAWHGGWFHTGDVVRRGPDGSFHFVDRKKNVIRRSGENISAVEVESVLMQHPAVRQVAVAPAPDTVRGDEVFACVVSEGPLPDAASRNRIATDIVGWCLSRLAYYKAPGYVAFVPALPLTSTQKIQRGALKELVATTIGSELCVDTRSLKKRPVQKGGVRS